MKHCAAGFLGGVGGSLYDGCGYICWDSVELELKHKESAQVATQRFQCLVQGHHMLACPWTQVVAPSCVCSCPTTMSHGDQ